MNINQWLYLNGFLNFERDTVVSKLYSLTEKIDVFKIRKKLNFLLKEKIKTKFHQELLIDWSKTKAFSAQGGGLIHVNCKDREPKGIVELGNGYEQVRDEIIEKLKIFKDPSTGSNIVKKVFKKEDIYHGHFLKCAPDLIVQPKQGYVFKKAIIGKNLFSKTAIGRDSVGTHDEDGIFIFSGKAVRSNNATNMANIVDIAPTVLYLLDLSIPDYMDGTVLNELINK